MSDQLSLPPLNLELFKSRASVSDILWRTKSEGLIRLGDMDDDHLRNTALMLIGMGYQTYHASKALRVRWLLALQTEWKRRMDERGANNGKTP